MALLPTRLETELGTWALEARHQDPAGLLRSWLDNGMRPIWQKTYRTASPISVSGDG